MKERAAEWRSPNRLSGMKSPIIGCRVDLALVITTIVAFFFGCNSSEPEVIGKIQRLEAVAREIEVSFRKRSSIVSSHPVQVKVIYSPTSVVFQTKFIDETEYSLFDRITMRILARDRITNISVEHRTNYYEIDGKRTSKPNWDVVLEAYQLPGNKVR